MRLPDELLLQVRRIRLIDIRIHFYNVAPLSFDWLENSPIVVSSAELLNQGYYPIHTSSSPSSFSLDWWKEKLLGFVVDIMDGVLDFMIEEKKKNDEKKDADAMKDAEKEAFKANGSMRTSEQVSEKIEAEGNEKEEVKEKEANKEEEGEEGVPLSLVQHRMERVLLGRIISSALNLFQRQRLLRPSSAASESSSSSSITSVYHPLFPVFDDDADEEGNHFDAEDIDHMPSQLSSQVDYELCKRAISGLMQSQEKE